MQLISMKKANKTLSPSSEDRRLGGGKKLGLIRCIGEDYKVGGRLLAKLDYFLPPPLPPKQESGSHVGSNNLYGTTAATIVCFQSAVLKIAENK